MPLFRSSKTLTSAEIYAAASDEAYKRVRMYPIRFNHMFVTGDLAHRLAGMGRPLVRASLRPGFVIPDPDIDLHGGYLGAGARASFDLLERVMVLNNRILGPGNFSILPCDNEGKVVGSDNSTDVAVKGFKDTKVYSVGEFPEDYHSAVTAGIAFQIAQNNYTEVRKVQRDAAELAAAQNGDTYAEETLAMAALHASRLIWANATSFPEKTGLDAVSFRVAVVPVDGYRVPAGVSYENLVTLQV